MRAAARDAAGHARYRGRCRDQALDHVGGPGVAGDVLAPRTAAERTRLDALVAAGRHDVTVEAVPPRTLALFA